MKFITNCIILILLTFSIIVAAAEEEVKEVKKKAIYVSLSPDFTANLADPGKPHYVRISADVMGYAENLEEIITHHKPAIRHELLMLLMSKKMDEVSSVSGKKSLIKQAKKSLNKLLEAEGAKASIEAVYFTKFLVE